MVAAPGVELDGCGTVGRPLVDTHATWNPVNDSVAVFPATLAVSTDAAVGTGERVVRPAARVRDRTRVLLDRRQLVGRCQPDGR